MKKKIGKKIGCLLAGCMMFVLAACGGKNEGAAARSKEHVFRAEQITVAGIEDANSINNIGLRNGRLYISTFDWKDDGGTILYLISQNMDGTDVKSATLEAGEDVYYSYLTTDAEGNYLTIMNESYEEDSSQGESVWVNKYYLMKLDGNGNELWRKELTGADPDMYWINQMIPLEDGRIVISDTDGMFLYDAQGQKTGKVNLQKELEVFNMYQIKDGSLVVRSYSTEKNADVLNKVNLDTGEVSEEYLIPGGSSGYGGLYAGNGYDFFLVGSGSIYGYNLGDVELTEIMNYIDSDLSSYYIYNFAAVDEREFYGITDDELGNSVFMKFTKVDPKDVKDKVVLTLACYGFDWDVRRQVVAFNKSNEEYRITVEDYSNYNTEEDYSAGLTRLNADIASGKVPEVL